MKRYLKYLVIKKEKRKPKPQWDIISLPNGWLNQKSQETVSVAKVVENQNPHTLLVRMYMVQSLWKLVWQFPKRFNTGDHYAPSIPL